MTGVGRFSYDEVVAMAAHVLRAEGVPDEDARRLATVVALAERDGTHSHGLARLPDYVASLRAGWVKPITTIVSDDVSTGLLLVDAGNGFTQVASARVCDQLLAKACEVGIAALCVRNGHHIGPLWTDVEPLAEQGFVALTCVNSRARLVPAGGKTRLFGSNAMAFACPGPDGVPAVWDQSSSVMSLGDIKLAAIHGRELPAGVGTDARGESTTDARAILAGGSLAPFAGHKGSAIAFLVEILAAGLSGGNFGFEDSSASFPGAASSNAGQFLLVIDPERTAGKSFVPHIGGLFERLRGNANARVPGDRRRHNRSNSEQNGIEVSAATIEAVRLLAR